MHLAKWYKYGCLCFPVFAAILHMLPIIIFFICRVYQKGPKDSIEM